MTSLDIGYYSDNFASYPSDAHIAVLVNGVYNQKIDATANATNLIKTISLPVGSKTVEFVNSATTKPSTTILSTYITSIGYSGNLSIVQPVSYSRKIAFIGDSITVGANATIASLHGYVGIIRTENQDKNIITEGYGYASLKDYDTTDLIARLQANGVNEVYIALGTNDYGLNKWAAIADFQTTYSNFLIALNTTLPTCRIIAQTPLSRTIETANGNGITMAQFRTAISNACNGKAYVQLVDGTTLLTTADLADGVHPTTAGHAILANNIQAIVI